MTRYGLLVAALVAALASGCAMQEPVSTEPVLPSMTADLKLGDSADAISSKHGKPLYKKGRTDPDGKKFEDWFYANTLLSFKEGSLYAFRPR